MTRLTTLNLPELARATVGFDRVFQEMDRLYENSAKGSSYPPYNIAQFAENEYMISLAVAGFDMDNLEITLEKNNLTVEGTAPGGDEEVTYLHKGVGGRNFRRQFTLADNIEVVDAKLELGMLNIHLQRNIPEEQQPKRIEIK